MKVSKGIRGKKEAGEEFRRSAAVGKAALHPNGFRGFEKNQRGGTFIIGSVSKMPETSEAPGASTSRPPRKGDRGRGATGGRSCGGGRASWEPRPQTGGTYIPRRRIGRGAIDPLPLPSRILRSEGGLNHKRLQRDVEVVPREHRI